MPRIQPQNEVGWSSERTHSAWGPTYRVHDCGWCFLSGGVLHRWEPDGLGWVPYPCPNCGGAMAYAVLVNTPPVWVLPL